MMKNISLCLIRQLVVKKNFLRVQQVPVNVFSHLKHQYAVDLSDEKPCLPQANEPVNIDYHEVKSYKEYLSENKKMGLGKAIITLMKTLGVTKDNAIKVVIEWKIFGSLSRGAILHNYEILREHGALKSTLRQNMYALADTTANVKKRIVSLEALELDLNIATPLFKLKARKLVEAASQASNDQLYLKDYKNRFQYLSNKLNVDMAHLCEVISNNSFMLQLNIEKIYKVTELLSESGMIGKHIINDIGIYRNNLNTIDERMARAKKAKISPLKPWVVRVPLDTIGKAEQKQLENENLFKDAKSLKEHIINLMNCDIGLVEGLVKRHPDISTMGIPKLTKNLELLKSLGYKMEDIYLSPMALDAHHAKLLERYQIWTETGLSKPPLFVLCTSKGRFDKKFKTALKNSSLKPSNEK